MKKWRCVCGLDINNDDVEVVVGFPILRKINVTNVNGVIACR